MKIKNVIFLLCIALLLPYALHAKKQSHEASNKQKIIESAIDAYIYAYPLVVMEITKQTLIKKYGPLNQFFHLTKFPDPGFTDVASPNVDTLYSSVWLDLSQGPMILHLPDTNDRYYLMELLDAWTNVFASIGKRTTGTEEGDYAIVGPYWKGTLPKEVKKIQAPTNTVWIIGRFECNGPEEYERVNRLQKQCEIIPIFSYDKNQTTILYDADLSKTPIEQTEALDADKFFSLFFALLEDNPPTYYADRAMVKKLKQLNIITECDKIIVEKAIPAAQEIIARGEKKAGKLKNGWEINISKKIGNYGTDYLLRAIIAKFVLGANLAVDAVYPYTIQDISGARLSGSKNYVLHFDAGKFPPVNAFWSLTMYDERNFLVANEINRYAIHFYDALEYNQDGSVDIYLQHQKPAQKEANWLPAPADTFKLILRLYWPKKEILKGKWLPPAVKPANTK